MAQPVYRPTVEDVRELALSLDPAFNEAVSRWEIEVGEDWLGEPAIHVAIVFKDSEIRRVWRLREEYRSRLRDALLKWAPGYFPFIRFDAESIALNPEQSPRA